MTSRTSPFCHGCCNFPMWIHRFSQWQFRVCRSLFVVSCFQIPLQWCKWACRWLDTELFQTITTWRYCLKPRNFPIRPPFHGPRLWLPRDTCRGDVPGSRHNEIWASDCLKLTWNCWAFVSCLLMTGNWQNWWMHNRLLPKRTTSAETQFKQTAN